MMQASDGFAGVQSYNDENDDFERKSLLPQQSGGNNGDAALRSRRSRRGVGVGPPPPPPPPPQSHHMSATIPGARFEFGQNKNANANGGRSAFNKITSISRIGRSSSGAADALSSSPFDGSSLYTDDPNDNDDHHGGGEEEYYYYYDDNNDYSWDCTFGTHEGAGIWLNTPPNDPPGAVMAALVWLLIAYSGTTVALLAGADRVSPVLAYVHLALCAMALASHAKTMFSDPGAVPSCAVPVDSAARRNESHAMCRACRSYKPPGSHHCRICNRCVCRMDHHCPWMNNCIGAANLKSFILFLCYTWVCSALALVIFGCNYFFCTSESCEFSGVLIQLVRAMTVMCTGAIVFVSSMLANVTFGIMTGSGTIDRLRRRMEAGIAAAAGVAGEGDDDAPPMRFEDVFGIGGCVTWFFPVDPMFPDHDRALGYSMPQRLLREGNDNTSVC